MPDGSRQIQRFGPVAAWADTSLNALLYPNGAPRARFDMPAGEAALCGPDSVSWSVFKNPVTVFIGGIGAVLLELAEPRVRTGVWEHTTFRTDPLARMQRTGLAAMVTVYGARSVAEPMIARVGAMHGKVSGTTSLGEAYRASDPELLDWVQATASYGFLQAYCAFAAPLSGEDQDRFYAEGRAAAALYGATGAPADRAELDAVFARMELKLEPSAIVFEFLDILKATPILPAPLRPLQSMLIRAGVDIVPARIRDLLGLGGLGLRGWERRIVRAMGRRLDRMPLPSSPAAQACIRLGLPADALYRS